MQISHLACHRLEETGGVSSQRNTPCSQCQQMETSYRAPPNCSLRKLFDGIVMIQEKIEERRLDWL
jgi:hypothetical protein